MSSQEDWPKRGDRVRVIEVGSGPHPELWDIELPVGKTAEFVLPTDARHHAWPDWFRLPFKLSGRHEMFVWTGPVKVEIIERAPKKG